jgi:hypothetical protein
MASFIPLMLLQVPALRHRLSVAAIHKWLLERVRAAGYSRPFKT